MSWNPLKKITSKSSHPIVSHSNSNNEENLVNLNCDSGYGGGDGGGGLSFEEIEKLSNRVNNVETSLKKVNKSGKKMTDTIINFNRLECKLSEDLANSLVCQQYYPSFRELVQDWHTFNCQTSEYGENLGVALQKMIVDPIKKFQLVIGDVKSALRKLEQLHETKVKLNSKVANLSRKDKTGPVFVQLEKSKSQLTKTEEEYDNQAKLIAEQVPAIVDCRIKYFQPCLEGLIKAELLFWGDSFETFNQHTVMNQSQVSPKNWNDYLSNQQSLLNSISSLSIVEGHD